VVAVRVGEGVIAGVGGGVGGGGDALLPSSATGLLCRPPLPVCRLSVGRTWPAPYRVCAPRLPARGTC
jgi:hypothetical protein